MSERALAGMSLLALLWLPGCFYLSTSGSFGSYIDPVVVSGIVPGETTKAEVLSLLGPPEEFIRSEVLDSLGDDETRIAGAVALGNRAQDAFSYQQDELVGGGSMLLLWNRVRARVESNLLVIFFDTEDRVRDVSFRSVQREEQP